MMAYNVENYIGDAIIGLQKENNIEWELIIIDDFSDDNTFSVAKIFADDDVRITLVKNIEKGKVIGTNYGYSLTKGDLIKCIDSDDVLLQDFFREYDSMKKYDAHCHGAYITDSELNSQAVYNINPLYIHKDYEFILSNLISFPKWSWSFNRELADKIFPMPELLPFEDVWMALAIKRYAKNIFVIEKPLYFYRQHNNQTFGGIINYSKDRVIFRAKRLLKLIDVLENEPRVMEGFDRSIFDNARNYNVLLSMENLSIIDVATSGLSFQQKIKIVLTRNFTRLAKHMTILKWKLDDIKN